MAMACLSAQAQQLYRISGRDLQAPSYIVGTYHLAEVGFVDSVPGLRQAMADCQQVYGELNMANLANPDTMMRLQQAMMLPEGTTLQSLFSPDELTRLNAHLTALLGTDLSNPMLAEQLNRLTPTALNTQLALLAYIKKHPGFDPQNLFDAHFQTTALMQGKPVGGLETIGFQVQTLYLGQTLERQKQLLMCSVDNPDFTERAVELVITSFYAQDLDGLQRALDLKMNSQCDSSPEEEDKLIYGRNAQWIKQMVAIMANKPTLFSVGAGHLPGERGVLNLLRLAGYTVEGVR